MFQGDKIENTLVATRLIATTVRIEIDMRDRLSDAEAAADKRIAIGVDSCDEGGIGRIEPNHRRRVAEMRFGRIEALEQRNQTDVRGFVDRCCNRTHFRRFARFRRVLLVSRIPSPCKQFPIGRRKFLKRWRIPRNFQQILRNVVESLRVLTETGFSRIPMINSYFH